MAGSRPKNKGWNYKLILSLEVLTLVVLMIFYGIWSMNHKMDAIDYNDIPDDEIEVNEDLNQDMEEYTNIVVFGGDSRDGVVAQGAHSDTVIIVNINNKTKEVRLVSVYRDSYLEIAKDNPDFQKLTHAHYIGGPKMAINTLNRNLDLDIKDYVTVNFESVIKAVDILGGIEVEIKKKEIKWINKSIKEENKIFGTSVPTIDTPGTYTLNGNQALAYARIRMTDQGDITRTERQRKVIGLMVDKAKKAGVTKLNELIDEIVPMISTSISKTEIISLATSLFSYELKDTAGFPFAYEAKTPSAKIGAVLVPADLEHNVMALHKYMFGTENYQVSPTVKRISDSILNQQGAVYPGIDILEQQTGAVGTEESSEAVPAATVQ